MFLTNRNLRARSEVTVELGERYADRAVEVVVLEPATDERPLPHDFPTSWDEPTNHAVAHTVEEVGGDGTVTLDLEPASIARLYVDNDRGKADIIGDNGVWHGLDGKEDIPIENNRSPGRGRERAARAETAPDSAAGRVAEASGTAVPDLTWTSTSRTATTARSSPPRFADRGPGADALGALGSAPSLRSEECRTPVSLSLR
ncbi:hypothetical protein ACFQL4_20205 [Halosimplex aquaticum]